MFLTGDFEQQNSPAASIFQLSVIYVSSLGTVRGAETSFFTRIFTPHNQF